MTTDLQTVQPVDRTMIPAAPSIGIFPGLCEEQYNAIPAVRSTHLKILATQTPRHLQHAIANPPKKKCFDLGNATHCSILQPERFAKLFCVAEQCCATKASGDRCTNSGTAEIDGSWYCGVHSKGIKAVFGDGRTVLSEDDYCKCIGMRDAAWAHRRVRKLLEAQGDREISAVWRDDETGLYGKFRSDIFAAAGVMADLKSTDDASASGFAKTIYNFSYHLSAAHYLHGAAKVDRPVDRFYFIPIEKEAPYGVNLLLLDDEAIAKGAEAARRAMDLYAECEASGAWPCYGEEVSAVGLPARAK